MKNTVKLIFVAIVLFSNFCMAEDTIIRLSSGRITGIYYPVCCSICRMINLNSDKHQIKCITEISEGSLSNLESLSKGAVDITVMQSDMQYKAFKRVKNFNDKNYANLRSLFSLHDESLTLITREDSGINSIEDIVGKRINIGTKGSGVRAIMDELIRSHGWSYKDFPQVLQYNTYEQEEALCKNKIDVAAYMVGHPNSSVTNIMEKCPSKIIPIAGGRVSDLLKKAQYFVETSIAQNLYNNSKNIKTIGVKATLVTTSFLSDKVAYEIVSGVFNNIDKFKSLHPAFIDLEVEQMARKGNTATLHKGAIQYYNEKGL